MEFDGIYSSLFCDQFLSRLIMTQNPWFDIDFDVNDNFDEFSGSYYGIFNRQPYEIARSLPRPFNPGYTQIKISKVENS
ncbi:hypothetical protein TVAG_213540 [Trichomonas vaginalis G3]|uniref:Uncharacterized protein n=1 Tax=Trichomonas vaginalis (strain ATCC PRA-98 / G3) TaxID=412133 RepID=A2EYT6_TRIV3|nr:hypothetical protein TVAGG3_0254300 [Trichomonas vaginalis G3]EAY02155.1 hypothetical protein TVAG_213540 [Trichomonas vaginalis G3]KAI5554252.1 hypothetical protein TVAGG3_0254300 [Trichomonas vaginalis G3]|eukprot:XP_001330558.1 hypothetical protein [Trichomonas vaginalis G3]